MSNVEREGQQTYQLEQTQQEVSASQQPQGVWEYLEHSERHADSGRNIQAGLQEQDQDFSSEFWRLGLLRGKIVDDGTPYENLILKLYETKIELWSANPRYSLSSLEEFGQFRSKYETMPEEQLPEEIRKQEKENRRKWLATATPEVKRKDWSKRYRQRRKEKRKRSQI